MCWEKCFRALLLLQAKNMCGIGVHSRTLLTGELVDTYNEAMVRVLVAYVFSRKHIRQPVWFV